MRAVDHYRRGLEHLAQADAELTVTPGRAQASAALASAEFQAAQAAALLGGSHRDPLLDVDPLQPLRSHMNGIGA